MVTDGLRKLWALAFPEDAEFADHFFSTAYHADRCRYFHDGKKVTAALYWLDMEYAGQRYAYIYGVGTHPECRGQGLCRMLIEKTHRDLEAACYAGSLLKPAGEDLRRMYQKMGYSNCTNVDEISCHAGTETTEVRAISIPEYAALRRTYLPEGGLAQEGENLTYLATYAGLYAGEDFLLAAVHGEEKLFGAELLGNPNRAPEILKAMGYTEGVFRVPGEEIPFAMYHPIQENAPVPSYLGLAFD